LLPPRSEPAGDDAGKFWETAGDILRDLGELLDRFGFGYSEEEIGGAGSVHLFLATKTAGKPQPTD